MNSVVVFGSLNMDLTIESERMPLQGETIPGKGFFTNPGGKGANQAVAAAKSGVPTYLIGAVGQDLFGDQLVSGLVGHGVRCDELARTKDVETGVAVVLRSQGDNRIVLSPSANHALKIADVDSALDYVARRGDVFLAQLECDFETTVAALASAKARGMRTIVNVAPPRDLPDEAWANIDVVCVNETECDAVCGIFPDDEDSLKRALAALAAKGPSTAIVTLGGRGSVALSDGRLIRQEALRVRAVDTTAAGDTFIGVVAASMVSGLPLEEGMRWASCAAGITASRVGAQQAIPTALEVDEYLKEAGHE
ncbi:ribokinase [Thermophilibacter provencensis]|uniref:Ribokinase n=1 Tax=Thermophilibacter provencensis TaxID=1852386 RepID=A0ABT7V0Z6_9ACTN|nr:ribokinase [Thermophilibacter provencensis]MDM8270288.1 ribokinase [Thermophilibacter provencensis]